MIGKDGWIILILTMLFAENTKGSILSVECPFPDGQNGQGEVECGDYTACEWTDDVCHMRNNKEIGYYIISEPVDTGRGLKVQLRRSNMSQTLFGSDLENLMLEVIYHEEFHVQIKITDANADRYEVPVPMSLPAEFVPNSPMYNVSFGEVGDPMVLKITRDNGNTIFKSVGPLTYEDQFIQFTTEVASTYLYGFGENVHSSFRHSFDPRSTQPIFARDQPTTTTDTNSYGAHPYHMAMEDNEGNSHSILLLTSNAMEYSTFLLSEQDDTPALTFRTIGGIIDMHIFMGPTPEDVNWQYISMIGTPLFPPYWALGFHLSRWGYKDTAEVRQLREDMKNKQIPQDVQVFDIDYMDGRRDFTIDEDHFGDLNSLIDELHNDNLKATLILDPAVSTEFSTYAPGDRGLFYDAYIKWSNWLDVPQDQPAGALNYIAGHVWPTAPTVFTDFLKPSAQNWWINEIEMMYQDLKFDSLWIDMNEPRCVDTNGIGGTGLQCPVNQWDDPPYPTLAARDGVIGIGRLSDKSICMTSTQEDDSKEYFHYDVHSLYGWSQSEPTYRALTTVRPGLRPLVMSRSTYPGSGKHTIHWLGDNKSEFEQMRLSIIAMMEFNMFGIPFNGADVCGFSGDATEELCARWTQLGAFYPFNRNHNAIAQSAQDPTQWNSVTQIAKTYLSLRYKYNPYLYLLLHKASMHGSSVVRPLLNVFPDDLYCRDVDDQFLWGDAMMIAPVLLEGATHRGVYFPEGVWYDLVNGRQIINATHGTSLWISAPMEELPIFARGGSILPWQEPELTTVESRLNPFGLTVAIQDDTASGQIFYDDGESLYDNPMTDAYMAHVSFSKNNLTLTVNHGASIIGNLTLNTVDFYGFSSPFSWVFVNGETVDDWSWNDTTHVLGIEFSAPMNDNVIIILEN